MRPMFCYPNWADAATLSGGSWDADFPESNVQDRRVKTIARSSDATLSSTQLIFNLGGTKRIDCVALFGTNLSLNASIRVSIDDAGSSEVYNSGWLDVYPTGVYPSGTELWGEPVSTVDSVAYAAGKRWPLILLPDSTSETLADGQYVTIEIDDTLNTDTFVDIGRVWISSSYQPTTASVLQGASFNIDDDSIRTVTDGGTYYFVERDRRKSWIFELGYMDDVENKVQILEMKRRLGTVGQILFVPNRDDEIGLREQSILGILDNPQPANVLARGLYRQPLRLLEEL